MFTSARFVAIDDNPRHLQALKDALHSLGTTCLDILYNPEENIDPFLLRGARVIFMDFHLSGLTFASNSNMDNSTIASIIKAGLTGDNQPYILVIWTQYPDKAAGLEQFLRERLGDTPSRIPMAVLCMSKESFLDMESGTTRRFDDLKEEISKKISAHPSMAALLDWEYVVHESASSVSRRLTDLVPTAAFTDGTTDKELNIVLSRFAVTNGRPSAVADPRASFSYALSPILADEVLHANGSATDSGEIWQRGTSEVTAVLPKLSVEDAAQFNRMAHVSRVSSETFRSSDWGAVVPIHGENDNWFKRNLGLKREEVWAALGLHHSELEEALLVMVRVGAQCDFAQQKSGPITYLIGGLVRPPVKNWKNKPAASVKRSITFVHEVDGDASVLYQLHVDTRLAVSFTANYARRWSPMMRLRESLMSQLLALQASHSSRPGILEFV